MSYEVFCRGEHAYCVPMVATQSDGRRQPEIEADKLREEIKDRGFTFIEADTQIKLTCFATGKDGFHPTAEWSRITQALKERDELAAELEMAEAERDRFRDLVNKTEKMRQDKIKELESLKSRLPVNADGDVVLWGDEVWMWDADSEKPIWGSVILITDHDGEDGKTEFMLTGHLPDEEIDFNSPAQYTYSTAESCAAHEKGE